MRLLRDRFAPLPMFLMAPEGVVAGGGGGDAAAGAAGGDAAAAAAAAAAAGAGATKGAADGDAAAGKAAGTVDAAKGAGGSLAAGDAAAAAGKTVTPAGLDDPQWREKLAGDDKGFLNQLKRHTSITSAMQWLRQTTLKVDAGELKPVKNRPGADAKPEEVAAWRKEQGLPAEAAQYVKDLKLADGAVPGEADKPLLDAVAGMALERGYSQEAVNDFVGLYYGLQDKLMGERADADAEQASAATQQLMQEMGSDFKPNMAALASFWKEYPPEVRDIVLGGRTADGRVIGQIPEVAQFYVKLARELNPGATLLPNTGGGMQDIDARIQEIDKVKYIDGKQNPAYFGGPLFKEYQDLIAAKQQMTARAK